MSGAGQIVRINPAAGIPGGEVVIECENFDTSDLRSCSAWFNGTRAQLVGASTRRVLAIVPEIEEGTKVQVSLESNGERGEAVPFVVGAKLAEDLHPVAN